jgi:hypothetical protein
MLRRREEGKLLFRPKNETEFKLEAPLLAYNAEDKYIRKINVAVSERLDNFGHTEPYHDMWNQLTRILTKY